MPPGSHKSTHLITFFKMGNFIFIKHDFYHKTLTQCILTFTV